MSTRTIRKLVNDASVTRTLKTMGVNVKSDVGGTVGFSRGFAPMIA